MAAATTLPLTARGTFTDNSTQDLTTSANWTSSMTSVATIDNAAGSKGLVTAVAAGATIITAAAGPVFGSTVLTVSGGSTAINVLPVTVNGSLCSPATSDLYWNKPCVSVTVCTPGTTNCQTINDILLDTGSSGLRIFRQALTVSLPGVAGSPGLASCIQFGDGSSLWGSVQTADVLLGNEPAVRIPIQVIDSTFGNLPAHCRNASPDPIAARYTGILGLGLFNQDCGSDCEINANIGTYYSCDSGNCNGATVSLNNQLQNPVALNNNGMVVQFPSVPPGGSPAVDGRLIFGIGNNVPAAVTAYATDSSGRFKTSLAGAGYSGFIDSGSNGILFTPPVMLLLPTCTNSSWFCPPALVTLFATITGSTGIPGNAPPFQFQIGNYDHLTTANPANSVFSEIGGTFPGEFDWGMPFFFLKQNLYLGFEGKRSSLGVGPYWAY